MKLWICLAAALLPAVSGGAAPMTQDERNRALSEFHASRKMFLDATEGLSAAQWNFKPDAGAWSVAECAEHIAISEDAFRDVDGAGAAQTGRARGEAGYDG